MLLNHYFLKGQKRQSRCKTLHTVLALIFMSLFYPTHRSFGARLLKFFGSRHIFILLLFIHYLIPRLIFLPKSNYTV